MKNEEYDKAVGALLEALGLDDADVKRVTVQPHQMTVITRTGLLVLKRGSE